MFEILLIHCGYEDCELCCDSFIVCGSQNLDLFVSEIS